MSEFKDNLPDDFEIKPVKQDEIKGEKDSASQAEEMFAVPLDAGGNCEIIKKVEITGYDNGVSSITITESIACEGFEPPTEATVSPEVDCLVGEIGKVHRQEAIEAYVDGWLLDGNGFNSSEVTEEVIADLGPATQKKFRDKLNYHQ